MQTVSNCVYVYIYIYKCVYIYIYICVVLALVHHGMYMYIYIYLYAHSKALESIQCVAALASNLRRQRLNQDPHSEFLKPQPHNISRPSTVKAP